MNYWNEKLQDDVYTIKAYGYESGREIEYVYAQKKQKDDNGEEILVDDKTKVKSFDGALIPRSIIERVYFADELAAIAALVEQRDQMAADMEEAREEESGDDGLLKEALSEKGELPKGNLTKRIKELEAKKTSVEMTALLALSAAFESGDVEAMEKVTQEAPSIEAFGIRNKNGTFAKAKIKAALKAATEAAVLPEIYQDEYDALIAYRDKLDASEAVGKEIKAAQKALDDLVLAKYANLSIDEIKHLLFDEKWMARLYGDINSEIDRILNEYASRVIMIAKRYEHTLKEIESRTAASKDAVRKALERMGYKW